MCDLSYLHYLLRIRLVQSTHTARQSSECVGAVRHVRVRRGALTVEQLNLLDLGTLVGRYLRIIGVKIAQISDKTRGTAFSTTLPQYS